MQFFVKHALPGRIRVAYDKAAVSPRQAALAQSLLSVQEGISRVTVNIVSGSFLLYYDTARQSQKTIEALFKALSSKYLDDREMLAATPEPVKQQSLIGTLAAMTVQHYAKRLLPLPVQAFIRVFTLAPRLLKGAGSLAHGELFSTDVLDAVAIGLAAATGDATTAGNINFLLNVGETIEDFTKRKSYENLAAALLGENDLVKVVDGKEEKTVPLSMLRVGDTAVARTGDIIPADGDVRSGEALVNQASITGEPLAVEKRSGQSVFAGTVVQEGEIFITVRAVGSQTKVKNILSMIDSSQSLKVSSQIRSEALAQKLVKYNFALALGTLLVTRNLTKVMSTLMVDYSCAMKLAAPVAVLSAMKEAAEHGILVKGGKFLEDAAKADTVVFDKTGTLTAATPHLARILPLEGRSEDEVLKLAACLEEHFAHPIANAIVAAADERGIAHPEDHAKVEYIVAHGIATHLDGKRLLVGSAHFIFDDEHTARPANLAAIQEQAIAAGESLLYLAEDGALIGIFAIHDPVRPDAADILRRLRKTGIRTCTMITGDDEGAARTVARAAGLDAYISRALPEDKVAYINKCRAEGRTVIMIGDGINDAPALAAANTGIAMGDCSDITGETADIVLPADDGLQSLTKTRLLGKRLMRRIDENNAGIIVVNSALIAGGLLGIVPPSLAALLHNGSTVLFSVRAAQNYL